MDGRIIAQPGSGIATYAAALRMAQQKLTPCPLLLKDDSCDQGTPPVSGKERAIRWLRAFTTSSVRADLKAGQDRGAILHAPDIFRLAYVRFRQTGKMLTVHAPHSHGLIHWSLPLPIRIAGWINIYTIHDVIPLIYPNLTPMQGEHHRVLLKEILSKASHIVTVTCSARQSIIDTIRCNPGLVSNCSIAVESTPSEYFSLPPPLEPKKYYIFAGSSEPRKNIAKLVTAYKRSGRSLPLLLIGPHANHADPAAGIWNLPYQPAERLSALIAQARALVFPSLAEGFGLPVVEAMALGTAVLTSNEGPLAEVAGGAALLVDARDESSITDGLNRIANDDDLVGSLERWGRLRATAFSSEKFTKNLSELYGELFSRSMIEHA
ncbi:glycosyltransferase family 4 protein [Sphingobium sp. MI1205]|uniref:glycosyltransferase family 4 protein n=1 Tax=Sphingobium sp. MI1205 TaxID=407020 RepID=UPI0007700EA0|nr:glycosyltransferase family 1 protein [Sphingobium sp. MI1205]AMK18966.1 group 1 glycosyl transferase [Sphingobium sp. MI1205]